MAEAKDIEEMPTLVAHRDSQNIDLLRQRLMDTKAKAEKAAAALDSMLQTIDNGPGDKAAEEEAAPKAKEREDID